MKFKANKTALAAAITAVGLSAGALPTTVSAVGLIDGTYDMTINITPYSGGYQFCSDGAWNSSFTFSCLPGTKGCNSQALYDDTALNPINGKGNQGLSNGIQGVIKLQVVGGVITGQDAQVEFDVIGGTAGGNFQEYGNSKDFTGSVNAAGDISLTTTGMLGTVGDFPSLVDERWNVDNFNGGSGAGTNFVPNPVNSNNTYDAFSTGSASNAAGTLNGSQYDGTTAVLVKGGSIGGDWGGFLGAQYMEVWNVSFNRTGDVSTIPVPAAVWLFGSGILGLVGVARRKQNT